MCEICSKLTIKTSEQSQWRCSGVFIINFQQISLIVPVFPLFHTQINANWFGLVITSLPFTPLIPRENHEKFFTFKILKMAKFKVFNSTIRICNHRGNNFGRKSHIIFFVKEPQLLYEENPIYVFKINEIINYVSSTTSVNILMLQNTLDVEIIMSHCYGIIF